MRSPTPMLPAAVILAALLLNGNSAFGQRPIPEPLEAVAKLKHTLRGLAIQQEVYFADSTTYAPSTPILVQRGFKADEYVTVVILTSSAGGWSAIAIHQNAPGYVCGIAYYGGNSIHPLMHGAGYGEPTCRGPDGKPFP